MTRDSEWVSQTEAARRLGLSKQAVGVWARRPGAPVQQSRGSLRLRWPDFPRWREQELTTARPVDLDEARARREAAMAEIAELDLAERRGELVTVASFDTAWEALLQRVRARLLALPGRGAPYLVALRDVRAAQAALDPLVDEVIGELRRLEEDEDTDDVDEAQDHEGGRPA